MLGGGAAAPADHVHPQLGDVPREVVGELVGADVVVHAAVHHLREPGVGDAGHRHGGLLGEHPEMLAHLGRAGGAVQPEHRRAQGGQGGQRRADLGAGQHPAGHLNGDLNLQRHLPPDRGHGPAATVDGCLGPEQVVLGLDDEQVHPAVQQAPGLDLEGVAQLGIADLAQRRQLGARPHRSGHPPGSPVSGVAVGRLPGDAGRGQVDLVGLIGDAVLGQRHGERPEGSGFHRVHPQAQVQVVHPGDELGPGEAQQLVAALQVGAAEIILAERLFLDVGSEGAVVDENPLARRLLVGDHEQRG